MVTVPTSDFVKDANKLLVEIHRLIDRQTRLLQGKLTPHEVTLYVELRMRLNELLERLANNQDG